MAEFVGAIDQGTTSAWFMVFDHDGKEVARHQLEHEHELCMQIQADILGVPVSRPEVPETTALGAAYAAGLAVGYWPGPDE